MILLTLVPVTTLDFLVSYLYPTYKTLALISSASARTKLVNKILIQVSRRSGQPLRLASRKIDEDSFQLDSLNTSVNDGSLPNNHPTNHSSIRSSSHNHSNSQHQLTGPNAHLYDQYIQWAVFWVTISVMQFFVHWFSILPYFYFLKVLIAFFLSHPQIQGGIRLYNRVWRDILCKSKIQQAAFQLQQAIQNKRQSIKNLCTRRKKKIQRKNSKQ